MDDVFGTLVKFFPIILIVVIRVLMSAKKARPSRPPEPFEEDEADDEESFRPHWEDDAASPFPVPLSNARNQAGKTEDRPPRVQGAVQPSFQSFARPAARSVHPVVQSSVPARSQGFRETVYKDRPALSTIGPVPETAPFEPLAGTREAAREAGTEIFPARLAQYTPLRRAVLMAEILGQPKGLDC